VPFFERPNRAHNVARLDERVIAPETLEMNQNAKTGVDLTVLVLTTFIMLSLR